MVLPPLALMLLAIAAGFIPGFWHEAGRAAAQTVDAGSYITQTLRLTVALSAPAPAPVDVSLTDIVTGLIGSTLAVLVAAVGVFGNRLMGRPYEASVKAVNCGRMVLESLQSGLMMDYVTWIVAGTAALGFVFSVLLR